MSIKIIAGNWKMNLSKSEADELVKNVSAQIPLETNVEVICIPPFVYLQAAKDAAHFSNLTIGAQDVSAHDNGAFTGDISAKMLAELKSSKTVCI